ncbi:uncharacterized protein LOC128989027 isoform X2 [Macrosteles quadrilineatus]|uniref:uncharacterized protein LOC128989027 isoform X2 n=1 Tax=Macrosteles quadrilineatus TaxID=74068 RepID=UPI0023E1E591|nr:uncharacterized protein LOC128989027 isoform X2 [Macrosteles quadrilineatus]
MGTPLLECSKGSKCEALTTTILREDHPKGHSIFCLLGLPTTQLFQGPLSHHRLPPGRIMIMPTLLPPGINYIQHLKKIIGVIFKILVQAMMETDSGDTLHLQYKMQQYYYIHLRQMKIYNHVDKS